MPVLCLLGTHGHRIPVVLVQQVDGQVARLGVHRGGLVAAALLAGGFAERIVQVDVVQHEQAKGHAGGMVEPEDETAQSGGRVGQVVHHAREIPVDVAAARQGHGEAGVLGRAEGLAVVGAVAQR